MKTAYLLGSLNRGGTETLLLDVFRNAKSQGLDAIGVYRKGGVLENDFKKAGLPIFKLTPRFPFDPFYLLKLRRLLKKENIGIVHAQQYLDVLYAWVATCRTNVKIIQTLHGFDDLDENKKNKLLAFVTKRTDKNIYVSDFQKRFYTRKYELDERKQTTVYNGISFTKFDEQNEIVDLPRAKSSSISLQIGMVGNFVRGREQNTVCRFLNLLKESNSVEFDFYFIGAKNNAEPWRYDDCVRYCEDNDLSDCVHFLGSRNDVPAILKQLDAFIYSTDHDTFGIAVIEAIACGIPVFVNDWEVMTEITEGGKYAYVYETKNERDLFNKFQLFLKRKDEYRLKAESDKLDIRRKYSIEKHILQLLEVYSKTIHSSC